MTLLFIWIKIYHGIFDEIWLNYMITALYLIFDLDMTLIVNTTFTWLCFVLPQLYLQYTDHHLKISCFRRKTPLLWLYHSYWWLSAPWPPHFHFANRTRGLRVGVMDSPHRRLCYRLVVTRLFTACGRLIMLCKRFILMLLP